MSDIQTILSGSLFCAETKIGNLKGYYIELKNIGNDGIYLVGLHEYITINENEYILRLDKKVKFEYPEGALHGVSVSPEFDIYLNLTNFRCLFFRGNLPAKGLKKIL